MGLSRIRLLNADNDVIPVKISAPNGGKSLQEVIRLNGGTESTLKHPYSGKILEGYVLPDGKYTFVFSSADGALAMTITED